ncbi:hypothetical protein F5888DRAFT_1881058 [Russula emetica]|nr:hypothetical protein F5888DRAFT_1881058 [Russula emetica]
MRAITDCQVEGFSSPDEVRTFYVERDMDGSEEDTSVLQFIQSDKRILALARAMYSRLTPFYSMSQLTTWMLLTLPGLRTILLASLTTHPSSSPTTRASRTTPSPTSSILTVSSSVITVVTSRCCGLGASATATTTATTIPVHNAKEGEIRSYLEWQLNVDPTTLHDFQARVQQDFAGPGPYPPMVLPQPAPAPFSHQSTGNNINPSMGSSSIPAFASCVPLSKDAPVIPSPSIRTSRYPRGLPLCLDLSCIIGFTARRSQVVSADSSPVKGPVIPHSHGSNSTLVKPANAVASAALTSLAVAPKKPKSACGQFVYATRADLTVYFGRCLPWIIIDAIPCFRKLQPNKVPTPEEQWECTKGVLFSHFTVDGPAIFLFHPVAESFGMSTWQVPFSSWQTMLMQLAFSFFFEDMFHYFCLFFAVRFPPGRSLTHATLPIFSTAHQLLHTPLLYKHIHKLHHKYSAPFGLAAEYAHPLEVMILGTGTILGPLSTVGPLMPIPDTSGAEYHDFHHMAFVKNFSTSFRWWDRLLGTDKKYLAYGERVRTATKGLDAAQRKAVEEKMVVAEEEAIPM